MKTGASLWKKFTFSCKCNQRSYHDSIFITKYSSSEDPAFKKGHIKMQLEHMLLERWTSAHDIGAGEAQSMLFRLKSNHSMNVLVSQYSEKAPHRVSYNNLLEHSYSASFTLGIDLKSFCCTSSFIFVRLSYLHITSQYPNNRLSFAQMKT